MKLEQDTSSGQARKNFRSTTPPVVPGLNSQPHQDPPVCDIDDFVDQGYDEDSHVSFQTNTAELLVPDVPLQEITLSKKDPSSQSSNKESNLAMLQHEVNLLEANLAEARKRRRMDMGDGRKILEDDSVDDIKHTSRSQPVHAGNIISKLSDTISGTPTQKKIRRKKLSNIHAFSGQPPLDPSFYIELLSRVKVPLSVLEIAQISPEAAFNWKRLMTRENSRKKKNARTEGNSVEVEDNLLEELYPF